MDLLLVGSKSDLRKGDLLTARAPYRSQTETLLLLSGKHFGGKYVECSVANGRRASDAVFSKAVECVLGRGYLHHKG